MVKMSAMLQGYLMTTLKWNPNGKKNMQSKICEQNQLIQSEYLLYMYDYAKTKFSFSS